MKSIRFSRIVVVADSGHDHILAARLRRMQMAKITAVTDVEEARRLCQSGAADACLVAIDGPVPDGVPAAESDAPGRFCGIPTLMVANMVTPHVRCVARRCGYVAVLAASIPSRMLYRRISAALQGRRARHGRPRRSSRRAPLIWLASSGDFDKPTLH
jgi:hypothetical protein